ncbi:MAG TPA: glycoside hydrolase domain-containing protein [Gemmatimonadaceae bacterium]|nr:glycoside hydrolase domain-containing protein [Gemmatimonadaceae bacterium]
MIRTRDALTALLAAAVVLGIGGRGGAPLRVTDPTATIAQELTTGVRTVAANATGRHLGFDTSKYPGDDAMQAWREDGSYEWVGYYLPAPCHKDDSWSGKRAMLQDMGWGMAVVYVGQQTWGKTPGKAEVVTKYVTRRVKQVTHRHGKRVVHTVSKRVPIKVLVAPRAEPGSTCSAHFVSGPRGRSEADDAIARTVAEGFPRGTVIFLDVEHMNVIPSAMRDYYRQWTARVLEDGRYRPGVYVHTANAATIYQDLKAVYQAAGVDEEPPFWIAGNTSDFTPDKLPTDVGHQFAAVWQGILDRVEERNGHKLPIDVNVAATPSPSTVVAAD